MTISFQKLKLPGLEIVREGKVRSLYSFPDNRLLLVATDRISAFDVVLPTKIPGKGAVLTQISNYWFKNLTSIPAHHLLETNFDNYPTELHAYRSELEGRSVIVKKADVIPFECVVRGYISGSLWKAYKKGQQPYGLKLPCGLVESSALPEPVFTPTTKADTGHDMPVTEDEMADSIGMELKQKMKEISLAVFNEATRYAAQHGIILADTKLEFGLINGNLVLVDECLTPDSSRFWPMEAYKPGTSQPSYDKQYVRDYLNTLNWDKTYPGPELPDRVVKATQKKYFEVYRLLTGKTLEMKQ